MGFLSFRQHLEHRGLAHAVRTMPHWKRLVLLLSLIAGVAGLALHGLAMRGKSAPAAGSPIATGSESRSAAAPFAADSAKTAPGDLSRGARANHATSPAAVEPGPTKPADQTTASRLLAMPLMARAGFSLFVGVVIGFLSRTFLRITAVIVALLVAVAVGLHYLHIGNIDLSAVKSEAASASSWLGGQAEHLKLIIFNALPSSTAAVVGFVLGFKR